jgi:hypothetical protein
MSSFISYSNPVFISRHRMDADTEYASICA